MNQAVIDALRLNYRSEVFPLPGGVKAVPAELYSEVPSAARGLVAIASIQSLVDYLALHQRAGTTVFASRQLGNIAAVVDWHGAGDASSPSWADHQAVMPLRYTEDWQAWTGISGKAIGQKAFLEFIEENLDCIHKPSPAEVLTIAATLEGKKNVTFKNGVRLASGDTQIQWEENTEAKTSGDIKIPTEIILKIPVYLGAEAETTIEIKAYFRYAIDGGRLSFTVKLVGVEKVADIAFAGIVESLRKAFKDAGVNAPVYLGSVTTTPRRILKERIEE